MTGCGDDGEPDEAAAGATTNGGSTAQGGGGSAGQAGSAPSGGACGAQAADGACAVCMRMACCAEWMACDADATCRTCAECLDAELDLGSCAVMNVCGNFVLGDASSEMLRCGIDRCTSPCGFD